MFEGTDLLKLKGRTVSLFAIRVSDVVLGDLPIQYKVSPKKQQPKTRPAYPEEHQERLMIVKRK